MMQINIGLAEKSLEIGVLYKLELYKAGALAVLDVRNGPIKRGDGLRIATHVGGSLRAFILEFDVGYIDSKAIQFGER